MTAGGKVSGVTVKTVFGLCGARPAKPHDVEKLGEGIWYTPGKILRLQRQTPSTSALVTNTS